MNIQQIKTLDQVRQCLISTAETTITPPSKDEGYRWIEQTLKPFRYCSLTRKHKGLIRQFSGHITGYSRQQKSLDSYSKKTGRVIRQQQTTNGFQGVYTQADQRLKNCANGLVHSLRINAASACQASPSHTSTSCAPAHAININVAITRKRHPPNIMRSVNDANRDPGESLGIFALIVLTRGIWMG